jgi:hypothetical protein
MRGWTLSSKASTLGEMHEGPAAFDRFKDALKRVLKAPKSIVTADRDRAAAAKKKPASKKR